MNNYLKVLFIFLLSFIFVSNVYAAENVSIESITLDSKSDNAEEINDASYEALSIKFNIKFYEVDDYVKYKIIINNSTNMDYEMSENKSNSEYIKYEYSYDDENTIIEKNKKSIIYITIKYNKGVSKELFMDGTFTETNFLVIDFGNETIDKLNNPSTSYSLIIIIFVLLILISISLILYKTTKKKKIICLFVISIMLLPICIYALEKLQIKIESKIEIKKDYLIEYNLDGGNASNPTSYSIDSDDIVLNIPTKDGYVFLGWSSYDSNIITKNVTIFKGSKGNKFFTAHWKPTVATQLSDSNELVSVDANVKIFRGADPNNYVKFNNEIWRVVGIYNNSIKIIRNDSYGNYSFDSNTGNQYWLDSTIMPYLNNDYYNSLSSDAKELIDSNGTWYIGDTLNSDNAVTSYSNSKTRTWNGKVGLVSTYEFLYAGPNDSCYSIGGNEYYNCGNSQVNWIIQNMQMDSWTLSPYTYSNGRGVPLSISPSGYVSSGSGGYAFMLIYPCVFIKYDSVIDSGSGIISDPYILS